MSERFDSTSHLAEESRVMSTLADSNSHAETVTAVDDAAKLKMLGYDTVLGRPLGFWSSMGMSVAYLGVLYDWRLNSFIYGYHAPLAFLIGWPLLGILHLILLGPMAELASAYPVTGAMATWSWQLARHGVGHPREWGWLVNGFVLAGHLGKTITHLYNLVLYVEYTYILLGNVPHDPTTLKAHHPKAWWKPVFQLMFLTIVSFAVFTRIARHKAFWVCVLGYITFASIYGTFIFALCKIKTKHIPINWSFPDRSKWTHSTSYMIFTMIPLKTSAIDATAHMSEETEQPQRNVPRVMYLSYIYYWIWVYIISCAYLLCVSPWSTDKYSLALIVPVAEIFNTPQWFTYINTFVLMSASVTQVISAVVVTSRFLFSIARDYGIPFADILSKTNKHKEPWVADIAVLLAMTASMAGWFINPTHFYNLVQAFSYWFMPSLYIIPLGLYLCSNVNLEYVDRTEFTLGRWSKPAAAFSFCYLLLALIQGSFPLSLWLNAGKPKLVDNLNSLPCILLALTLVMVVTWLIYGRYHFIGPVRAFAKWTTGIDIDFTTARGRSVAIEEYIRRQTTRTPSIPRSGFALSSIFRGRSEKPVPEVPPTATWPRSPIPEIDISDATGLKSAPAAAEPQLLPSNTRRIASRIGKIDEEHSIPMQPLSPTQSLTFVVPETGRGSETGGGGGGRNGRSKRKSPPEHTSRIGTVSVLDALPESQLDPTATLDIHELRSLQFPRHYN